MKKGIALIFITAILIISVDGGADISRMARRISDRYEGRPTAIGIGEVGHNCSMWAAISNDIEDEVIYNHLIEFPHSLKNLSQTFHPDGWGIAFYPEFAGVLVIERGPIRAYYDLAYDSVVAQINQSKPKIALAHIRNCSSGCCCHDCDSIANPHPFWRNKNGRFWTFEHNGDVDKSLLYDLIGAEYLAQNPPNGSGIPACDPSDTSMVIDSELFFLFILKHIEENNWDAVDGIISAITELVYIDASGILNFVLSDGSNIWAFRRRTSLYYLHDPMGNYSALATIYPSSLQGDWQPLFDYELIVLSAGEAPLIIPPVYLPGDFNGDGNVLASDVTYGVLYLKGLGSAPPDSARLADSTWLYVAADVNGSCVLNGADITFIASYFKGIQPAILWCTQIPPFARPTL